MIIAQYPNFTELLTLAQSKALPQDQPLLDRIQLEMSARGDHANITGRDLNQLRNIAQR